MGDFSKLACFVRQWVRYLESHGHRTMQASGTPDVCVSRNGRGKGYRWLCRLVGGHWVTIAAAERKEMRRQARLARNAHEKAYLVLRFGPPAGRVVVLPARQALKAKRVSSERGGIPWEC
jgi:hypothetical protein